MQRIDVTRDLDQLAVQLVHGALNARQRRLRGGVFARQRLLRLGLVRLALQALQRRLVLIAVGGVGGKVGDDAAQRVGQRKRGMGREHEAERGALPHGAEGLERDRLAAVAHRGGAHHPVEPRQRLGAGGGFDVIRQPARARDQRFVRQRLGERVEIVGIDYAGLQIAGDVERQLLDGVRLRIVRGLAEMGFEQIEISGLQGLRVSHVRMPPVLELGWRIVPALRRACLLPRRRNSLHKGGAMDRRKEPGQRRGGRAHTVSPTRRRVRLRRPGALSRFEVPGNIRSTP